MNPSNFMLNYNIKADCVFSGKNADLCSRLEKQAERTTTQIVMLEKQIETLKKQLADTRDKLSFTEVKLKDTTIRLQEEIRLLKEQLARITAELKQTASDRDKSRHELQEISDRTRKLLTTLGMSNDIDSLGLSLDHARNLSYVTRKQNMGAQRRMSGMLPEVNTSESGTDEVTKKLRTDTSTPRTQRANSILHEERVCLVCHRAFSESENFSGACVHHAAGANRLYVGTELEVWSCCKSRDTLKGCVMDKHVSSHS